MNDNPNTPQYYRLLESGEQLKTGDVYDISNIDGFYAQDVSCGIVHQLPRNFKAYFRPVTVDEWIPYSERKPTREDFEPTGKIECLGFSDKEPLSVTYPHECSAKYWRRITPPQPAKPKSVEVRVWNDRNNIVTAGLFKGALTLNPDGSGTLDCGDVIAADCLDEIFKARNSVMEKGL